MSALGDVVVCIQLVVKLRLKLTTRSNFSRMLASCTRGDRDHIDGQPSETDHRTPKLGACRASQ